jgi:peptidylprolyl isomerase domain and WD repeat-containing protein 1
VARILGKVENTERFLRVALFQGESSGRRVKKLPGASSNAVDDRESFADPTLVCCAFKKHRFYLFRYKIRNSVADLS